MTKTPDLLFSVGSKLKTQLQSIPWHDVTLGPLDLDQLVLDRNRARVLVLDFEEAQRVWNEVESRELDLPCYPVIVGGGSPLKGGASALLKLAPAVEQPIEDAISGVVQILLRRQGQLYRELSMVDSYTRPLAENSQCEWVRCSIGIVGIARVQPDLAARGLKEQLELLRSNAYGLIDRVSSSRVSTDDLWTLLLIVEVPWTRDELNIMDAESEILRAFVGDTTGSRKMIMSSGESISSLVGPVTASGSSWYPATENPLRDELNLVVKDENELRALEVVFNKRLPADDFDRLVATLGRKP